MNRTIVPTRGHGNPRVEAAQINEWVDRARMYADMPDAVSDAAPHGLPPSYVEKLADRFESFLPKAATTGGWGAASSFFDGLMPQGATLALNAGAGYQSALYNTGRDGYGSASFGGRTATTFGLGNDYGSGNVMMQPQRPYYPEFDSQDRQSFPIHRQQANMYWRLFYKLDPVIGQGVDMYSELPWGNFSLSGEGVDGEIKAQLERMIEVTRLKSLLPYFVKEYLVVGEVAPHLYYSDTDGIWTYCALQNPDYLDVVYVPSIKMDPIVQFRPDPKLRQLITSNHPLAADVRATMPPEILAAFSSGQPIPLFPPNFSLIARRLHPYEVRGTSILSRMWRALMLEDGIFNASIATARRHAGPIKVAKIGDPASGTIPNPAVRDELLRVLAQCEIDPHAWLVWHYGIQFDLVGSTERMMTIDKHWDLIERIKLIALGISKAFLHGEVTYASAASGLSIFLRKLKSLRQFFEDEWLYPRFFRQVAVMNGWVKRTPAELAHGVRVVRSQQELVDMNAYVVPKLEWEESLNPTVDSTMINAMKSLTDLGVHFSQQSLNAIVGRDWEKELRQRGREAQRKKEILAEYPELAAEEAAMAAADGGGGGGMLPGLGPDIFGGGGDDLGGGDLDGGLPGLPGDLPGGEPTGAPPEPLDIPGGAAGGDPRGNRPAGDVAPAAARADAWTAEEIADFQGMLNGHEPDEEPWKRLYDELGGPPRDWPEVRDWLYRQSYPESLIADLQSLLKRATGPAPRAPRRTSALVEQRRALDAAARKLLERPREYEHPDYVLGFGTAQRQGGEVAAPRPRRRR